MNCEKRRILIRGPHEPSGGYGSLFADLAQQLILYGYQVQYWPVNSVDKATLPAVLQPALVRHSDAPAQLLLFPPRQTLGHEIRRTIHFTMWETSCPPPDAVDVMNRAAAVVAPCDWNVTGFAAAGVRRPIYRIGLWVDSNQFPYSAPPPDSPFVFGAGGTYQPNCVHKNVEQVIQAFRAAFPKTSSQVTLKIKCGANCPLDNFGDPRIQICRDNLSSKELVKWYQSIHVFCHAARGEGWGLMPHQAMSIGRPLIAPRYSGLAEFFNENAGWCVPFDYTPATHYHAGSGHWAQIKTEHLSRLMNVAKTQAKQYRDKCIGARTLATRWSVGRAVNELIPILHSHSIFY